MQSEDHILRTLHQRKQLFVPIHYRMRELALVVDGKADVFLPELNKNEKPAVPNSIKTGLEGQAKRVGGVAPVLNVPAVKKGDKRSERYAGVRRDVLKSWWNANKLQRKTRQRALHLIGYGLSPVVVSYDRKQDMPTWQIRSPLECFPATSVDSMTPGNVIFCYRQPLWWLLQNYPDEMKFLYVGDQAKPDDLFEIVDYYDEYCHRMIVVGKEMYGFEYSDGKYGSAKQVTLDKAEHELGMCPVVVPTRTVLNELMGAFDTEVPLYYKQAEVTALWEHAVIKGIFADPWLEPLSENVTPQVVVPADGKDGTVGIVKGGRLHYDRPPPDFAAVNLGDRYERAIRTGAGVPAEWGGESQSNVRTGARGDAIMSATVDPHLQEYQELLAESRFEEDRRAIAWDKKVGGKRAKTFFIGSSERTYVPEKHWETDNHVVRYPLPGADATSMRIGIAQDIGTGQLSPYSAMELNPLIEDAEFERQRIIAHRLDEAGLTAIEQQAAQGTIPIADLAQIKKRILRGMAWEEAVEEVQREAQERQAAQAEPGAPETMPGLSMPGMGAEAGAMIPEPTPSVENLAQVFSLARRPNMTIPGEAA